MDESGKSEKPTPVRASDPGPAPPAPSSEDGAGAPIPEPTTGEEARRPTPVRMAMEGVEAEGGDGSESRRVFPDPHGGEDWVVTVGGRSASGVLPLRTVALLELNFARVGEPQTLVRRALCPGEDLESLPEERLLDAFQASQPYRPSLREKTEEKRNRRGRGRPGRRG